MTVPTRSASPASIVVLDDMHTHSYAVTCVCPYSCFTRGPAGGRAGEAVKGASQHISTRRECGHNCVPRPTHCDPSLLAQATWSIKSGSAVSRDWGAPHVCVNRRLEERASFGRLPIHDNDNSTARYGSASFSSTTGRIFFGGVRCLNTQKGASEPGAWADWRLP